MTEKIYKTPLGNIHYWVKIINEDEFLKMIAE